MRRFSRQLLSLLLCAVLCFSLLPGAAAADSWEAQLSAFPESYRNALRALHEAHPTWQFRAVNTGLSWSASIAGEFRGDTALISLNNAGSPYKNKSEGCYDPATDTYVAKDSSTWIKTTETALCFFMDPRNFLDEVSVFQFLDLSFNEQFQTQAGVETILKGTFMSQATVSYLDAEGNLVETEETYSDLIMEAARTVRVNPYYLASKIRQEMGVSGSGSCSGDYGGYKGVYNFYNIGASSAADPILNGLAFASAGGSYGRPWNTPRASILGGAEYLAAGYIAKGQDTAYYVRFNVAPDAAYPSYTHQYATNISAAAQEALSTRSAYAANGLLEEPLVFTIPVFENMPARGSQVTLSTHSAEFQAQGSAAVNVRSGPGTGFSSTGYTIAPGETVTVLGTYRAQVSGSQSALTNHLRYPLWHQIRFTRGGKTLTGYVCTQYFAPTASLTLETGGSQTLTASVSPAGSGESVYYETENYQVAAVSASGTVTAVSPGTTVIRVYSAGGGMDAVKVTVKNPPWKNPYTDVSENDWFYSDVEYVTEEGLFQGSGGKFSPQSNMTRAMFVTVLHRLAGTPAASGVSFTDVPSGTWYTASVTWAAQKGLVTGSGNGTFRPNDNITRQEMALIFQRYARLQGISTPAEAGALSSFRDAGSVASWARDAVAWAVEQKLLTGSGGKLNPTATATRCQVAAVVHRYCENFS